MKQLELQKETEADPYIIFEYSIRSPYTKESYFRRLKRFFDAISLEGPTFESRCNFFAEKGKQDPNWAFNSILKFVLQEKNQEEGAVGPVRVLSNCCLTNIRNSTVKSLQTCSSSLFYFLNQRRSEI